MPEYRTHSELFYAYKAEMNKFYILLLFGLIMLAFSVYEYKSGKVWEKLFGWVHKDDHPYIFWADVIGGILGGTGIICYSIFRLWNLAAP